MPTLTEWLKQVGFQGRNPFALKQADDEGEWLQTYFVEHPAYNTLLDFDPPRSSILHAPRGAGKSSSRRMFEDHCIGHASELRPLLIRLVDWMPLVERASSVRQVRPRDIIQEIYLQAVRALTEDANASWLQPLAASDLSGYLNWICLTYEHFVSPAKRGILEQRGWIVEHDLIRLAPYRIEDLGVMRQLELLVDMLIALGYQTCFVLIDRIDELVETAGDCESGADLLAPLLGNLLLNQIPGLAFKYFVPTEVIEVLRQRKLLRDDRITCAELSWNGPEGQRLLRDMLRNRLYAFSNNQLRSLASLSAPDLRDIDNLLVKAAGGSPRRLLNLGDALFQACASTAIDDNHLLIEQEHLEAVLTAYTSVKSPVSLVQAEPAETKIALPAANTDQTMPTPPTYRTTQAIPLLRVDVDGSIWRGDHLVDGWQKLPALQRRLLEYLYMHRGTLCYKDKLLDYVWADKDTPADEDSLHKLAMRLIKFIEPDPGHPIYIQRIYGGFYRLDNAADTRQP